MIKALVPVDGSENACRAARHVVAPCRAARLHLAPKVNVLLVHILPPGLTVRLRAQAEADARQPLVPRDPLSA